MYLDAKTLMIIKEYRRYLACKETKHKSDDVTSYLKLFRVCALLLEQKQIPYHNCEAPQRLEYYNSQSLLHHH